MSSVSLSRDRMQHLGRRALQEPDDLSIPLGARTAECHKPVAAVPYRVERHGWGEGRLPIPAFVDVKTEKDLDAVKEQKQAESEAHQAQAAARAAAAAKMIRAQKLQPHQQLDTLKARAQAAREFSAQVDKLNAERLRKASSAKGTTAAGSEQVLGQQQQQETAAPSKLPLVERHIPPADASTAAAAAAAAGVPSGASATDPAAARVEASGVAITAACEGAAGSALAAVEAPSCQLHSPPQPSNAAKGAAAAGEGVGAALLQTPDAAAAAGQQAGGTNEQLHAAASMPGSCCGAGTGDLAEQQPTLCQVPGLDMQASLQQLSAQMSAMSLASEAAAAAAVVSPACSAGIGSAQITHVSDSDRLHVPDVLAHNASGQAETAAALPPATGGSRRPISSSDASCRLLSFSQPAAAAARSRGAELQQCCQSAQQVEQQQQPRKAAGLPAPYCTGNAAARPGAAGGSAAALLSAAHAQGPAAAAQAAAAMHGGGGGVQGSVPRPHWSPVPPATQLVKPLLVRPMSLPPHAVKAQPLVQVQQPKQQQKQQPKQQQSQLDSRPPWQGVKSSSKGTPGSTSAQQQGSRPVVAQEMADTGNAIKWDGADLAAALSKVGAQGQKQHLVLPALCSCGHLTSPLDPAYPSRCCSNCPLHNNMDGWKRLLLGLLGGMGLLDGL